MMRVIAGEWRGRRLVAPRGLATRPSAARLREALFSALGPAIRGAKIADLFAGSGALGIESLSRGAAHVTFVEHHARAIDVIETNLRTLEVPREATRILRSDAWAWLQRLDAGRQADVEIVLADPPYDHESVPGLLPRAAAWVQSGALGAFVLEHPAKAVPELADDGLRVRTRKHGRGAFTIVERELA